MNSDQPYFLLQLPLIIGAAVLVAGSSYAMRQFLLYRGSKQALKMAQKVTSHQGTINRDALRPFLGPFEPRMKSKEAHQILGIE